VKCDCRRLSSAREFPNNSHSNFVLLRLTLFCPPQLFFVNIRKKYPPIVDIRKYLKFGSPAVVNIGKFRIHRTGETALPANQRPEASDPRVRDPGRGPGGALGGGGAYPLHLREAQPGHGIRARNERNNWTLVLHLRLRSKPGLERCSVWLNSNWHACTFSYIRDC